MSTDCLNIRDAWGNGPVSAVLSPYPSSNSRQIGRPKSVPPSLRTPPSPVNQPHRPKTAAQLKSECNRVYQLEHEATRKQSLEAHLPSRRSKAPPWQRQLDEAIVVPTDSSQYYGITKFKDQVKLVAAAAVASAGKFVAPSVVGSYPTGTAISPYMPTPTLSQPNPAAAKPSSGNKRLDPESTSLISQLQQQIDDLTLFLEEERLNHKETKRKAGELLRDRIESLQNQHENATRSLEEKHKDEMEEVRSDYDKLLEENQKHYDTTNLKMRGEIEFLQGAFESYKSQLLQEMDTKWNKKQDEMKTEHDDEMEKKLQDLKSRMLSERSNEQASLRREFQMEIGQLKKDNKKEIDALMRRFANHAGDLEKLKETHEKWKELEAEHEQVVKDYNRVCRQLTDTTRELTDTKVKLIGFEQHFSDKVQEIDDRYKAQMHELMTQNTEIRRQYVKKCGELFDEKAVTEEVRSDQLSSAKQTMKLLIETRERAVVNMAAGNPELERRYRPRPKQRPCSAPLTKLEAQDAQLGAGQTDRFVYSKEDRKRPATTMADKRPATTTGQRMAEEEAGL